MNKLFCALALLCLCAAAAGCGNWSNEDLQFLYALPSKDALEAAVPDAGTGSSQGGLQTRKDALTVGDASQAYRDTVAKAREFNRGLMQLLTLLDFVRHQPPAVRRTDFRQWGPWTDDRDRTRETRVVIQRFADDAGGHYEWSIELRRKGDGEDGWVPGVEGQFLPGDDVRFGTGSMEYDARRVRDAGFAASDDPGTLLSIAVRYATEAEPRHVELTLVATTGRLDYSYDEDKDGGGSMSFELQANWAGSALTLETLLVASTWTSTGAGRADYRAYGGDFAASPFNAGTVAAALNGGEECWDPAFRVTFSRQRYPTAQQVGDEADCAVADPQGEDNAP